MGGHKSPSCRSSYTPPVRPFVGQIHLWSGSIVSIPAGWKLCDGNNGTPDLRNKFIPGAGDEYTPGDTGGAQLHEHMIFNEDHVHNIIAGAPILSGIGFTTVTDDVTIYFDTDDSDIRPLYYSLAFIMYTG